MYKPAYLNWIDPAKAAERQHAEIARITGLGIGRLLEVGSGHGEYLGYFQDKGWECLGIESDDAIGMEAMGRGVMTLHGEMDEVGLPKNSYDLVRIRGALGGFDDPDKALRIAYDAIHETGFIIAECWNESGWPSRPEDDQTPRKYSKKQLIELFTSVGFEIGGIFAPNVGDEIWAPLRNDIKRPLMTRLIDRISDFFDRGSMLVIFAQRPPLVRIDNA